MKLSRQRWWASLQPTGPEGAEQLHVLSYDLGQQCSLRVGDGDCSTVLAQEPTEQGRMTERMAGVGNLGLFSYDEDSGNLRSLQQARTWFAFEPDAPPERIALREAEGDHALIGMFRTSHDPSGLRADRTEGSGFEHVNEPTEYWQLSCFADGAVVMWQGLSEVKERRLGRSRRNGDRIVIMMQHQTAPADPSFDNVQSARVDSDDSPESIPYDCSLAGTLQNNDGRPHLNWGGRDWTAHIRS